MIKKGMNESNKDITLKELLLKIQNWVRFLFSKWHLLLMAGLIGGTFGFLYAHHQKKLFIASTTFVLEQGENNGANIGQMAGLAALAGVSIGQSGGGIFQGENLFELYRSRKMIEATLLLSSPTDSALLLLDRYLLFTGSKLKWESQSPDLLQIDFRKGLTGQMLRSRDSILQAIVLDINKHYLSVGKYDKKSSIIKVDVSSPDEVFSKEFNQALVSQVNNFYVETKTRKSLDNIRILQRKADSVRAVMYGDISVAASVTDATPNLNPTRFAQRLVPTQRSQFSAETNKTILGQLVQNLEMSKMTLLKDTPLIQVIDEPIYPLPSQKLSKIKFAILGAVLTIFLCVSILLAKRMFKYVMSH